MHQTNMSCWIFWNFIYWWYSFIFLYSTPFQFDFLINSFYLHSYCSILFFILPFFLCFFLPFCSFAICSFFRHFFIRLSFFHFPCFIFPPFTHSLLFLPLLSFNFFSFPLLFAFFLVLIHLQYLFPTLVLRFIFFFFFSSPSIFFFQVLFLSFPFSPLGHSFFRVFLLFKILLNYVTLLLFSPFSLLSFIRLFILILLV